MWKAFITLLLGSVFLPDAAAQRYAPGSTAAERLQLPKYCWSLYIDEKLAKDPQYTIPPSCGIGMNHLCPGLLLLNRAGKASDPPNVRRSNAGNALGELGYTRKAMTKDCPLRGDVEAAIGRANSILANTR